MNTIVRFAVEQTACFGVIVFMAVIEVAFLAIMYRMVKSTERR